jgi:hypothetical protein
MKTAGIILIVLGAISTIGALAAIANGHRASLAGLSFIVLGAFLISRVEKKKMEKEKKKKWSEGNTD